MLEPLQLLEKAELPRAAPAPLQTSPEALPQPVQIAKGLK